jgi:hypothetical protein
MPSASKFPRSTLKPAARLRSWRVSLLRPRARYLGTVEARDEKAAEATAVKQFGLNDDERRRLDQSVRRASYTLAGGAPTILVACSKCEWWAAFSRDDLIASYGAGYPMPNLLDRLAEPGVGGSAPTGIAVGCITSSDFTASAASAMDFTEGFYPSSEMEKLWGPRRLSETINEQVSHVGFCRKAEQFQKLGASEMVRVKSIIDKEVGKFERTLRREFRPSWKPRQSVPLRLELLNNNVSSVLLDLSLPDIERLVGTMVQARDAVGRRPWSHSAEPTVGRHPGRSPRA